jgi:hypothetical protein
MPLLRSGKTGRSPEDEKYATPMSVSLEKFEALVKAAVVDDPKVPKVAVTGYTVVLTLKARRVPYDVWARYDPATDTWTGHNPYRDGMTLHKVVDEVRAADEGMT